jgi:hypothetical protein
MILRYSVVVFCVMNFELLDRTEAQQINGNTLANELDKVADDVGGTFIQVG